MKALRAVRNGKAVGGCAGEKSRKVALPIERRNFLPRIDKFFLQIVERDFFGADVKHARLHAFAVCKKEAGERTAPPELCKVFLRQPLARDLCVQLGGDEGTVEPDRIETSGERGLEAIPRLFRVHRQIVLCGKHRGEYFRNRQFALRVGNFCWRSVREERKVCIVKLCGVLGGLVGIAERGNACAVCGEVSGRRAKRCGRLE